MSTPEPVWDAYAEGETQAAIDRHCPRCHAQPGDPCTNPVTGLVSRTACLARLTGKGGPHVTNANKRKGDDAERAVRDYLRLHGFPHAERTRAGYTRDYGDIHPCPGLVVQVKNTRDYRWTEWWTQLTEQIIDARADHGVLVRKLRGNGYAGEWIAAVPLSEYVRLLHAAGYGSPVLSDQNGSPHAQSPHDRAGKGTQR